MSVRVTIEIGGRKYVAKQPFANADHVVIAGVKKCPACGETFEEGIKAMGSGKHIENHDTYKATGHAKCCGQVIGTLRATVDTIFGLEEDEAVLLRSRCRVY